MVPDALKCHFTPLVIYSEGTCFSAAPTAPHLQLELHLIINSSGDSHPKNLREHRRRSCDCVKCSCSRVFCPHRCRVVPVSSGSNHPAQNLHTIGADVSCCIDAFLCHHLAVDQHSGTRLADGNVELKTTETKPTCSLRDVFQLTSVSRSKEEQGRRVSCSAMMD